jgi:demethylmenaquinone methyltransferase/2-methoxy-6-polyprenyl-1,4-benzoquinol methylase
MAAAREGAGAGKLEAGEVSAMFNRIAGVYDALNTAMTAGLHHRWRERAVDLAAVGPGDRVLDVATGTGDLALALARRVAPDGTVLGSDFAEGMLERARAKAVARSPSVTPTFEWGDALELPYENASFDAVTVGFGARNFSELGRGLREMARVVRPGGRVVVLEITTPTKAPLSSFYGVWFDRLVPVLGRVVASVTRKVASMRGRSESGDGGGGGLAEAYTYLPNSVKRWPGPAALEGEMEAAGLARVFHVTLAGGIVAIHVGTVGERA